MTDGPATPGSDRTASPPTGEAAPEPNPAQRALIESTEGVTLVDAGAGTGKTFAVTRRYAAIVDRPDLDPADVLLVTFTTSAATEMRERVVEHSGYAPRDLADAPIRTFHAHCNELLQEHGYDAPSHLGIDDHVTDSTGVVEDDLIERALFREFVGQFREDHPEYADFFRALGDPAELLEVVRQLAAKGIVPTAEGWYRDCETHLDGDPVDFRSLFDAANEPRNDGNKQSDLRAALGRYGRSKIHHPDAPSKDALRGERGTKQLDPTLAARAFEEPREELKAFVHDVYHAYLAFALERNYLTFGFLQVLAYVLLCEDHALRDRVACQYVMVDEFQDTSAIQFELALLLSATDNLCLVGDWKQSIYSFQYADVGNITDFETRLARYRDALNDDADRVAAGANGDGANGEDVDVTRIELVENYRSTQSILDFSERALATPATDGEEVDDGVLDDVVSLSSNAPFDETVIEAIAHEDEYEAVLTAIQRVVGNDDYPVEDENGDPRPPTNGDVAVLTRTRAYGRELLAVAETYDLPIAYDGGVELFRTDAAKLVLAWLRIAESDADRGWAVVLERAGYAMDEIDHLLSTGTYPSEMAAFREDVAATKSVGSAVRRVLDRYGFDGDEADVLLHTIQSVHDATSMTRGALIRFVERAIDSGATHEVHTSAGADSVTVQTVHAAKGLEYPIVILANMNDGAFPPAAHNANVLRYEEPVGLRQTRRYDEVADHAHPHVYHSWRHDVIRHCLPDGYDEERRLLYVAITRAEHHVVFAAGDEPNAFLAGLPVEVEPLEPALQRADRRETTQAQLPFSIEPPEGPIQLSAHDLLDERVFEDGGPAIERDDGPRGLDFGSRVHAFAEDYARGRGVSPDGAHERTIATFLDDLDGEIRAEVPAWLPLDVDGVRVTVSGVVDLVSVGPERVAIVDYKTDQTRRAHDEYRNQLSVYYHVLDAAFPDREVSASVLYTAAGERAAISPLSVSEIEDLVGEALSS